MEMSVFLVLSFLLATSIEWHLQNAVEPSWQCRQSKILPYPSSREGNTQVISLFAIAFFYFEDNNMSFLFSSLNI